ncbi:tetratricopeptide repeat protein [bacterium]|nr:tetratricopeptide repeat protein [bacterium]
MKKSGDLFRQGVEFQEQGLFDLAIQEYNRALELTPNCVDVLINLGAAYLQKGLPEKSIQVLQKALQEQVDHPTAMYNLGKAHLYREEAAKALSIFEDAQRILPNDLEVKKSIAQCLISLGKKNEVVELLNFLIEKLPQDPSLPLSLGTILMELERFSEALDSLKKASAAVPDSTESLEKLARCQMALGTPDKAITSLKRALMIEPKNPDFHIMMVDILIETQHVDDAIAHLKQALSSDPSQPLLRGKIEELTRRLPILKKRGEASDLIKKAGPYETLVFDALDSLYDGRTTFDEAVQTLQKLRAQDPHDLFIANELANLLFQTRQYDEAKELYFQIHRSDPSNVQYRINLAKSLALAGNVPSAKQFLEDSIAQTIPNPELSLAIVELQLLERDYEAALGKLETVLKNFPEDSHGRFLKGYILMRLGNLEGSGDLFKKLIQENPQDEELAVWFSRIMILKGAPNEAIKVWDRFQDGLESLVEMVTRLELSLACGNLETAEELVVRVRRHHPRFLEDHLLLGKAFFYAGDLSTSAEKLHIVTMEDPENPEALAFMAMTSLLRNKTSRFWMLWQKAIDGDSIYPVLLGITIRKLLNSTQIERLRKETKKLSEFVRNEIDRSRLNLLLSYI